MDEISNQPGFTLSLYIQMEICYLINSDMKRFLFTIFACHTCLHASWGVFFKKSHKQKATQDEDFHAEEEFYQEGSRAFQILARYLQGAGVGYSSSYTTLECFVARPRCVDSWVPFMDLRGLVFNNGTLAANAGLGLRYVGQSVAFGVNTYYDYRQTKEFHYNQVGVGLEAIGSFWGVNVNGYIPVGTKKSPYFDPVLIGSFPGAEFAFFQGHNIFVTAPGTSGLLAKTEFAFTGVDANAFFRIFKQDVFALDFGIGPYYFHGSYGEFAAGAKASLTAHCTDYVFVNMNGSYDNLFRLRGQVGAGIAIPLGPKSFTRRCKKSSSSIPSFYDLKLARGPDRNEVIVVDDVEQTLAVATAGGTELAINPRTGQPYYIIFVNNLSSSDGTFEDPYPTIQEALTQAPLESADIIYVYEGDGTPYDVDNITLIDDLMFLGSGIDYTLATTVGTITIPPQSPGYPTIENTVGTTMLTFANRNTVSGFILEVINAGDTVVAAGIDSLVFSRNNYHTSVTASMTNMRFTDCIGSLFVEGNQFVMDPADAGSYGIALTDVGTGSSLLFVSGNSFINHAATPITLSYTGSSSPTVEIVDHNIFTPPAAGSSTAIDILTSTATVLNGSISNQNILTGYNANNINLNWDGTGQHTFAVSGNTISTDPTAPFANGINLSTTANSSSITIANNQFTNQIFQGISCFASNNAAFNFLIDNNNLTAPPDLNSTGISVIGISNSILNGSVTNNKCTEHKVNGISIYVNDSATINATVDRNQIFVSETLEGRVGISAYASNSTLATSSYTISNNTCSGHVEAGIQAFPNNFSEVSYNISGNTLVSARSGVTGQNTYGMRVGPGNNCHIPSLIISNNRWTGPETYESGTNPQGFQVGVGNDSILTNLVVSGNRATLPLTSYQANNAPVGITLSAFNQGTISAMTVSKNSVLYPNSTYISDVSPQGIQINSNDDAIVSNVGISNNSVTFANLNDPSVTNFYPQGIQVGSSQASLMGSSLSPVIVEKNVVFTIGGTAVSLFANGTSSMYATVDGNRLTAQASGIQTTGINASATDTTITSYVITNNICLGHSNGAIQGFPNGNAITSYVISNNFLTAVTDGIANTGAVGIQVNPNGNANTLAITISGNTWRGPSTYQPSGTPQGIQVNIGDNNPGNVPTVSNVVITGNTLTLPFTSYPTFTGFSAMNVGCFGSGQLTGVVVSLNTITYPNSTYVDFTSPQGINIFVSNGASQIPGALMEDAVISQNTVTFAPLQNSSFTQIGMNGIAASADNFDTTFGTIGSPILITNNTVLGTEGNGITVNSGSDNDVYITTSSNYVSLGTISGNGIGIISNMGGSGHLISNVIGNTIDGNNGAFFGIVCANGSPTDQSILIENNTVRNIHSTNGAALPLPDLNAGGGIGTIPLNSGSLTVVLRNNALSGNTPQGTLGILSSYVNPMGPPFANLCITYDGNHGIGSQPPDSYRLYHFSDPGAGDVFSYYDAGNNTGTFIFYPDSSFFNQLGAPCP